MADDLQVTPGSGATIGADEISAVKYQRVKTIHGADGTNDGDVSKGNGFPIGLARAGYQALVEIAFGSLTGSFASAALSGLSTGRAILVDNDTDANIYGSFDAGTTTHAWFPAKSSRTMPIKDAATQLYVKHDGTAAAEGKLRLEVLS